jgi:hypothetical protein
VCGVNVGPALTDPDAFTIPPLLIAPGRIVTSDIQKAWEAAGAPKDRCKWLKENRTRFDRRNVKKAEKYWNCRGSRVNR